MSEQTAGTATATVVEVEETTDPFARLTAQTSKTRKSARIHPLHSVAADADDETGDIILRIPQRIPFDAVYNSKTEKAVPMVSLMPRFADGRSGAVNMPVVVYQTGADGVEVERVFGLRIGCICAFVTE